MMALTQRIDSSSFLSLFFESPNGVMAVKQVIRFFTRRFPFPRKNPKLILFSSLFNAVKFDPQEE